MNFRIYRIGYRNPILFCSLLLFSITVLFGQKEPQYTQYMYNIGSFNPAYVGTVETPDISGLYRVQWSGIPGAPKTLRFGVNLPLANEKNGLGFNVVSDQLGPTSQTYIDFAYSFQVKLSDDTKLSFGVDAGGSLLDVDYTKGDFENPNEPLLNNADTFNKFYPTIGAGMFMYQENWYVGLSVPNFLTSGIYADEVANIIEDKVQFNFIGGYVFDLSEGLKFKPAFLMNYLNGAPLNLNLSTNFLISDLVTLGASYRLDNAISGLAGLQISNSLFMGYSYDYNTNGLGEYSQGSHEVILKFYLGKAGNKIKKENNRYQKGNPKQIDSPRFF
ncbi:type IX secretion system membrane protein PorP/SprF [Arenibacter sp. BSSL-BM3]|uniref:Type IX secretion system membrane protein PorP/SprF n=1 Tax=Arenibacter arenosicollis TaxID=2762274 RepID=A0ABR7QJ24_9FLAO|nr:type IX secretion system membrane protein PorP/SprF [Arenibacter arenosicollis]MBC8767185.1 type IX secretion system membrane protein PorP/SprF [Arenibacter arenosicollis]